MSEDCTINVVQREEVEARARVNSVIHDNLPKEMCRRGGVHTRAQVHVGISVGKPAEMQQVAVRQEHGVHSGRNAAEHAMLVVTRALGRRRERRDSLSEAGNVCDVEALIPPAVEEEPEAIDLQCAFAVCERAEVQSRAERASPLTSRR